MTKWTCKEGKATVEELKERFGEDIDVKVMDSPDETEEKKAKTGVTKKKATKATKVTKPKTTKKTKAKEGQTFVVRFKPEYWFELQREVWIDEKLRSIFKDVEMKVSRSFNGFIEDFAVADNITADEQYYLKTGKRKVWIGYKGKEPFSVVIKRIFLKGIKMNLVPTAWED